MLHTYVKVEVIHALKCPAFTIHNYSHDPGTDRRVAKGTSEAWVIFVAIRLVIVTFEVEPVRGAVFIVDSDVLGSRLEAEIAGGALPYSLTRVSLFWGSGNGRVALEVDCEGAEIVSTRFFFGVILIDVSRFWGWIIHFLSLFLFFLFFLIVFIVPVDMLKPTVVAISATPGGVVKPTRYTIRRLVSVDCRRREQGPRYLILFRGGVRTSDAVSCLCFSLNASTSWRCLSCSRRIIVSC